MICLRGIMQTEKKIVKNNGNFKKWNIQILIIAIFNTATNLQYAFKSRPYACSSFVNLGDVSLLPPIPSKDGCDKP